MPNASTLLPTSVEISDDLAIEYILTDIPLFCEGIMGIGLFTFLFLTKRVKLISIFLYGSTFLAFASATLDLSQVVVRGRANVDKGIGLGTVTGFIISREVLLALSLVFLNLSFWLLTGHSPHEESNLSHSQSQWSPVRSASWNRWGIVGQLLRWTCLIASFTVGLLQLLWRLIPQQRSFSSLYVAESTLQSTLTATFILKLLLNMYISPLSPRWRAIRAYLAPMVALLIGASISISDLMIFEFCDSSLGRFLRAVQVYILMVHHLCGVFEAAISVATDNYPEQAKQSPQEKSFFRPNSPSLPTFDISLYNNRPRSISMDSTVLRQGRKDPAPANWNTSTPSPTSIRNVIYGANDFAPPVDIKRTSPTISIQRTISPPLDARTQPPRPSTPISQEPDRPVTAFTLSYYGSALPSQDAKDTDPRTYPLSPAKTISFLEGQPERTQQPSAPTSQRASISSIDELLRQQAELDKTIAALQMTTVDGRIRESPKESQPDEGNELSRSFTGSVLSKSESFSAPSEFSLSNFPAPPAAEPVEAATKYVAQSLYESERDSIEPQPYSGQDSAPMIISLTSAMSMSSSADNYNTLESAGTRYDVTSFIGGLTNPSRYPMLGRTEDSLSEISTTTETPTIGTVFSGPSTNLRPMILSTTATNISSMPLPKSSGNTEDRATESPRNMSSSAVTPEAIPVLRPLLIGKPVSSLPRQIPSSSSIVPLAQRRKRGDSFANGRRPLISAPVVGPYATPQPGAFERPRPPPLRLIPENGGI